MKLARYELTNKPLKQMQVWSHKENQYLPQFHLKGMFLPIHQYLTASIKENCMLFWLNNYFCMFFQLPLILLLQTVSHRWNRYPKYRTCWIRNNLIISIIKFLIIFYLIKESSRYHEPSGCCSFSINFVAFLTQFSISSLW